MKRTILSLIFSVFCASSAFAENLYVTQSGAGAHTGLSLGDAWSAAEFNSSSNWGAGSGKIGGGDTVHLSGTITANLTMQASGSSGSVLTIDGTSATISGGFNASNRSYFTLQNITTASGVTNTNFLDFSSSSNATIANITMPNCEASYPIGFRKASYITVSGITMNNCRYGAIRIDTDDMTPPHHMTLSNLNITTTNDYMASIQRDLITTSGAHDITIEKSFLHKRWSSQAGTVAHNDIWQFWGNPSNPYIPNPYNIMLRHSKLITDVGYDGNYQFLQWEGSNGALDVYGNVFIKYGTDSGGNVIALKNLLGGAVNIYNNTFVQKDTAAYYLLNIISLPYGASVNFKNNVVYNSTGLGGVIEKSGSGTYNHQYNTYYGGQSNGYLGTSCASYISTGEACNSNPQFYDYNNDDFRIGINSPAYNKGENLGSPYNIDMYSTTRGGDGIWDIGAFEYNNGIAGSTSKIPGTPLSLRIN